MEEYYEPMHEKPVRGRRFSWRSMMTIGDGLLDWFEDRLRIMVREKDLFLGTLLLLLGLLNFHSGKYCDGNTADYLSCTRPVTYYYYSWLELILIILGVFLILIWLLRRDRR